MTDSSGRQFTTLTDDAEVMSDLERARMSRKHVFCVNGSSAFLEFVRTLLEEESYNVTTTNFIPSTFTQIAAIHPDLLIIDLEVGKRAGWNLLEQLQADVLTNDIPAIIVSTDQRLLDHARADEPRYGGEFYIVKPFDIDDLLGAVHTLIGAA